MRYKNELLIALAIFFSSALFAQPATILASYNAGDGSSDFDWEVLELFEESELFEYGESFIWVDYQAISSLGSRPDHVGTIIPPSGLHYEKRLVHNLTMRLDANLSVWEEQKVLVRAGDREFTELFEYRYWTAGIGANWHFNVHKFWDPYIGFVASYRRSRAFCDCVDENRSTTSIDFLVGTRYFLFGGTYLLVEVGNHGVGFISGGLGFQF